MEWKQDRIGTALRGKNPTVLRRLSAGFANIGDVQFLPGYCILLTDRPDVQRLAGRCGCIRLMSVGPIQQLTRT